MTLTVNGKNYIADKFGLLSGGIKCYTATGLSWSVLDVFGATINESGGTAQIVSRIISSVVQSVTINGQTHTIDTLRTQNDNTSVSFADVQWIAANDASPVGEALYCFVCQPPTCNFSIN